jgi:DNA-binding LacI/PurR family transcriptional regulator
MTRITMLDVAREAEVSRTTVSNAFNHPSQLSSSLRIHVLETAKKLGYVGPNPSARAMRAGRTGMVGVVFREVLRFVFEDPFARGLLLGLSEEFAVAQYGLSLLSAHDGSLEVVKNALVDGVIAYRMEAHDESLDIARRRGLKVVRVGVPTGQATDDLVVSVDDHGGAYAVMRHLAELGHRSVYVFFDMAEELRDDVWSVDLLPFAEQRNRWLGYSAAAAERNIELRPMSVGRNLPSSGYQAAARLIDTVPVTAIVCVTDSLALGVLAAVRDRGMIPGQDVSVVGFDDVPEAFTQELTTIAQPIEERGRVAGRLFLADPPPHSQVILRCRLMKRQSTGAAQL